MSPAVGRPSTGARTNASERETTTIAVREWTLARLQIARPFNPMAYDERVNYLLSVYADAEAAEDARIEIPNDDTPAVPEEVLDWMAEAGISIPKGDRDAMRTAVIGEDDDVSGEAVRTLDPGWRESESGESVLVFPSGTIWDADTERIRTPFARCAEQRWKTAMTGAGGRASISTRTATASTTPHAVEPRGMGPAPGDTGNGLLPPPLGALRWRGRRADRPGAAPPRLPVRRRGRAVRERRRGAADRPGHVHGRGGEPGRAHGLPVPHGERRGTRRRADRRAELWDAGLI